jgi:hypothetical protein
LYTSFLLREFAVQGARLEDAFKRVRLGVRLASHGAQVPWESTSLEEDLYLFPHKAHSLSDAEKDLLLENEMKAWLRVKSSPDPEALAGFIREYPSGSASELAQSRMNRMLTAMAEKDGQRLRIAAQSAANAAKELAAQAEAQRMAAQLAEEERLRAANAAALAQIARIQQARITAQALTESAAEARMEAKRQSDLQAQAAAQRESARQSELQAQKAAIELQRLRDAQAEKDRQERAIALQAQQASAELARLAALQQAEASRLAAQQQSLLVATASAPPHATLNSTPFFKGYDEHQRQFSVGDEFSIRVIDMYTKASKPLVMKVTQVDLGAERVNYNDGEFVSDLMGNTTGNQRGLFSTPRQFYPAELIVGKKWHTRFKQARPNGVVYTFQYDLKVVGRERVTVPAGTFDTYKIEARGFNMELGAALERNIWVAPGVNADIAHEIRVRLRNGSMEQNDRQELVSFAQAR